MENLCSPEYSYSDYSTEHKRIIHMKRVKNIILDFSQYLLDLLLGFFALFLGAFCMAAAISVGITFVGIWLAVTSGLALQSGIQILTHRSPNHPFAKTTADT